MATNADKVGGTNNFFKAPHTAPQSMQDHAANMRELERVVNEIPAGAPPQVTRGAKSGLPGDGSATNAEKVFRVPAGDVQLSISVTFTTADTYTAPITNYQIDFTTTPLGTLTGAAGAPAVTVLNSTTALGQFTFLLDYAKAQDLTLRFGVETTDGTTGTSSTATWAVTITPVVTG